ncbi:MAG: hypothetical protein OSJ27_02050 [Candidatus Gastranaerophilales bacterium]|nr:hypothetical protein [Candidatus Gastranaerophilales bacterium]
MKRKEMQANCYPNFIWAGTTSAYAKGYLKSGAYTVETDSGGTYANGVRCVLGFGFFEVENICKRRLLRSIVH